MAFKGWAGERWSKIAHGYGISFWSVENVLKLIVALTTQFSEHILKAFK